MLDLKTPATRARRRLLFAALLLSAASPASAEPLPAKLQAVLFKKIFLYDRTLGGNMPTIAVVNEAKGAADAVAAAFTQAGMKSEAVTPKDAPDAVTRVQVVYVFNASTVAKDLTSKHGVLTISGDGALVQSGAASVAVHKGKDGTPEILVNLARVRSEQHDFAADLLNLATVIK